MIVLRSIYDGFTLALRCSAKLSRQNNRQSGGNQAMSQSKAAGYRPFYLKCIWPTNNGPDEKHPNFKRPA